MIWIILSLAAAALGGAMVYVLVQKAKEEKDT